jgi:uncharacterized protein
MTSQLERIEDESNEDLKKVLLANKILIENEENDIGLYKYFYYRSIFENQQINLNIAPTMDCNFACFYCFEEGNKFPSQMNANVEDAIVLFLEKNKKKSISITWFGGEPLIGFNNIMSISKKLKDKNIIFGASIITNGSLFNDKIISQLEQLNLKRIQISLDGIGETHNKRRFLKNKK